MILLYSFHEHNDERIDLSKMSHVAIHAMMEEKGFKPIIPAQNDEDEGKEMEKTDVKEPIIDEKIKYVDNIL